MMKRQHKFGQQQLWMLLAYGLAVMAMFSVKHHAWQLLTTGVAACVLLSVVARLLWWKLHGDCNGSGGGRGLSA